MFVALDSNFTFRFHKHRHSVRRAVSAECQVVAENGFRLLGERTLDVSRQGLLLASRADASIGESVFVALKSPNGCSWLDAEGFVARVLDGGIAIRFTQMSTIDRIMLAESLRGLPPPVPRRRPRPDYAATVRALAA